QSTNDRPWERRHPCRRGSTRCVQTANDDSLTTNLEVKGGQQRPPFREPPLISLVGTTSTSSLISLSWPPQPVDHGRRGSRHYQNALERRLRGSWVQRARIFSGKSQPNPLLPRRRGSKRILDGSLAGLSPWPSLHGIHGMERGKRRAPSARARTFSD